MTGSTCTLLYPCMQPSSLHHLKSESVKLLLYGNVWMYRKYNRMVLSGTGLLVAANANARKVLHRHASSNFLLRLAYAPRGPQR